MGKTYKKNGKNRFEKKKLLATKHKKKYPKMEENRGNGGKQRKFTVLYSTLEN